MNTNLYEEGGRGGSQNEKDSIDLWCEKGISHDEIKRRLSERSDAECLTAVNWCMKWKIFNRKVGLDIAQAADRERNAEVICNKVEPFLTKRMRESVPEFNRMDLVLELHALVVEAYVRAANEVFPRFEFN